MDVATSNAPMNLESVTTTSMVDDNVGEPVTPPAKKQRFGQDMNRVAEIVLVLSALGRMRGGDSPTKFEFELMLEARSKLAELCQGFTPEEILRKDDVNAVIEDLGFNGKLKDQRLGFRASRLTISEKLSLGKRKMEEAKKYSTPAVSNGYASHLSQPNGSVASPGFANKVSVAHQWPSNAVPAVNTAGSHLRTERPQMMLNNGASQGTPNSSANYYAAPWSASAQPQSTISFSTAPDKKVPIQSSVRVADPSFRPFMSQTPHGTFPGTNQPMHYGQTSSFGNNHGEIATIIQKVLQPRVKQYPLWNPPSREYMSRAMTCEMCQVTINEVDTLLICDACEKAYHLTCLQANNMKGVPKSEWHCSRCVQVFNGKPFPPQYGRAITTTTAKMSSSSARVQPSAVKKLGYMDIKVNQQKPIVTPGVQNLPGFVSGAATTSQIEPSSVNANTTASAAKTSNIGSQSFQERVICGANPSAVVSLTETPNPTAIASTSAVINNGLISKPLTPVGTMSSTSPLPVGNQGPVNATSNATPSITLTASLVAQAPTVTKNGDSSSTASVTADHAISNADLTTQVHILTVTSSSNPQPTVSHSEDAKATKAAAPMENVVDEPQALTEYVAGCENPSGSASHSDSVNVKTTSENDQEASKDAKVASETCQNHPTESSATVVSDQDSKITAEPSKPLENSAYQTEKTSQPLLVSSNYHSQTEKETPNVQDSLQYVPGDSQEGKCLNGLDDRHQE